MRRLPTIQPQRSASTDVLVIFAHAAVDDTSPLISYAPEGSWTHPSGSDVQAYINQTCSVTSLEGATASFTFNGTGFWLYGAKKPEYGVYVVMLDDEVISYSNASASQEDFNQLLGGQSGLQDGQHHVTLMAGGLMDLDAVTIESSAEESQAEFAGVYVLCSSVVCVLYETSPTGFRLCTWLELSSSRV